MFSDEGEHMHILREIDDMDPYIPIAHKKDYQVDRFPPSLYSALYTFILSNAIADLESRKLKHRSMMINVSRFTLVQDTLTLTLKDILSKTTDHLKLYSKLHDGVDQSTVLRGIYQTLLVEFPQYANKWDALKKTLYDSSKTIEIRTLNLRSTNKTLNYHDYEDGMRVIVVGGISLSRGLTLEGLITSYIHRNSIMYDTLLQMGRWFGYRDGYEDLCRIWLSPDLRSSFGEIGEAIRDLKEDLKTMRALGKTPDDFGLKVRTSTESLIVTARNKMRTAKDFIYPITLDESIVETPLLYYDDERNLHNRAVVRNMILEAGLQATDYVDSAFHDVDRRHVVRLIKEIKIPYLNIKFNQEAISELIEDNERLDKWDIVFISGGGSEIDVVDDLSVRLVERKGQVKSDDQKIISISHGHQRLGTKNDTKNGLSSAEIDHAINEFEQAQSKDPDAKKRTAGARAFLRYVPERNPLLMIYHVGIKDLDMIKGKVLIGFGIAIPSLSGDEDGPVYARYKVNIRKYRELLRSIEEEDDDELI
jgi:hypothetical protein